LKLNNKDIEHLNLFNSQIKSDYKINAIEKNKVCLNIFSVKLVEQLNRYGVMPRKTFTIKLPELRDDLYNDFIRGFFDGDGCMYIGKGRDKCFSIYCASDSFRKSIIDYFDKLNIKLHEYGGSIRCTRKSEIITIYDFLYDKENLVYLNRKKEKFKKLIN
jgi:intein/homing endonuclease